MGAPLDEGSPLERRPEARGPYTRAKLEAELLVRDAVEKRGLHAVILRPGQIFGRKLPLVNAAFARRLGRYYVVLGDGTLRLPLVYIDDVVDAIIAAIDRRIVGGEIVQLVDESLPTQNEVLRRALGSRANVLHVPRPVVFGLGWLSEIALGLLQRESPLSRYRLRSALARRTYRSDIAKGLLGWTPRTGVNAGIELTIRPDDVDAPTMPKEYAATPT